MPSPRESSSYALRSSSAKQTLEHDPERPLERVSEEALLAELRRPKHISHDFRTDRMVKHGLIYRLPADPGACRQESCEMWLGPRSQHRHRSLRFCSTP